MSYVFNDTDLARQRLEVLANVYAPSTRTFLHDAFDTAPRSIVDLGCGPGYTTHLLADALPAERVVGLDVSANFIDYARKTASPRVSFMEHDITSVPFPTGPVDMLYCRFLLTHLRDPQAIMQRWLTQVHATGLLLVEEVEWIHTKHPLLARYLQIVASMMAQQANDLYVGPRLNAWGESSALRKPISRVQRVPVATADAATMFHMNIQVWKHRPFIRENYAESEIKQIEESLHQLAESAQAKDEIEWGMRQLALQAP